jgi:CRISPR/Cas system-associated exonuclease Cas4 (RecB family)
VVGIDAAARQNAETAIAATRRCLAQSKAPQAVQDLRCEQCSLKSLCLPAATAGRSWSGWLTDRVGR